MTAPDLLIIRYTNWRMETADRTIKPIRIWWGNTDWHPNNQWMMEAYDVGKGEQRDFALANMVFLATPEAPASALASSPEVAALIAEAVARGMKRAAKVAAKVPVTAIKSTEQTAHTLRIVEAIRRAAEETGT